MTMSAALACQALVLGWVDVPLLTIIVAGC